MSLTCQIVIRNDINKVKRLLESLQPLQAELLVVDGGSNDGTKEWFQHNGVKVFDVGAIKDYSMVRNMLASEGKHDWHLVIHPWEVVTEPDKILEAIQGPPQVYSLPVLKGDSLSYEERLSHRSLGVKFKNPVFEQLDADGKLLPSIIFSDGDWLPSLESIGLWKAKSPQAIEPVYYEAFYHLAKSNWDRFLSCSAKYLFTQQTVVKSTIMMKYYTAIVLCHIKKDINGALKHIIECLAVRPIMAEYWCVLGDIFYHLTGDLKKAKRFYRNAIVMGSKRGDGDMWPIELSKYNSYPEKMIKSCEELEKNQEFVKIPQ